MQMHYSIHPPHPKKKKESSPEISTKMATEESICFAPWRNYKRTVVQRKTIPRKSQVGWFGVKLEQSTDHQRTWKAQRRHKVMLHWRGRWKEMPEGWRLNQGFWAGESRKRVETIALEKGSKYMDEFGCSIQVGSSDCTRPSLPLRTDIHLKRCNWEVYRQKTSNTEFQS